MVGLYDQIYFVQRCIIFFSIGLSRRLKIMGGVDSPYSVLYDLRVQVFSVALYHNFFLVSF